MKKKTASRSYGHLPTKEVKTFFKNIDDNYSLLNKDKEFIIFNEIIDLKNKLICTLLLSKVASQEFVKLLDSHINIPVEEDGSENEQKEEIESYTKMKKDIVKILEYFSSKKGSRGIKDEEYITSRIKKHFFNFKLINNLITHVKTMPNIEKTFVNKIIKIEKDLNEKKNYIVGANIKLVAKHCQPIRNDDMDYFDLMSEGVLGIITAIEKFDINTGNKFSTYATFWIKHAIGRAIQNKTKTIRVPVHIQELNSKIYKKEKELLTANQEVNNEMLAKELNVSLKKINLAKESQSTMMSMSNSMDDDGDKTFEDQIASSNIYNVEDMTIAHDFSSKIDITLVELKKISMTLPKEDQITDVDIFILKHRLGLSGAEPISLETAGEKLKLTKERVRQLEHKLDKKCKNKVIQSHMKTYLMQ